VRNRLGAPSATTLELRQSERSMDLRHALQQTNDALGSITKTEAAI
jgi:hypothetical protein